MTVGVNEIMSGAESSIRLKRQAKIEAWRDGAAPDRTTHTLHLGDARDMADIREPVHLVVTSPPYFNLVDYDGGRADDGQLGGIDDYESFLDELDRVWRRCYDLLTPGGRLCVVVGSVCISRRAGGRHHVLPLPADISVRARRIGFDYLTPIRWYKIANMATEAKGVGFLGKPYEPNAIVKNDVETILMLRKPGSYRKPTAAQRALSLIEPDDHQRWFRSIWEDIRGEARKRGHPAPFPVELASRLIQMFSFVGDTVLDPFWGTGTTTAAAMLTARSSIGYEIEPRYLEIGRGRLGQLDALQVPAEVIFPLKAPEAFVRHLAENNYHPRSNAHSNVLCLAIVDDLLAHCPAIAERARAGEIVAKLNHTVKVNYQDWTIDLAVGPPPGTPTPPGSGSITFETPATIELALEAKAIMTEHGKARRNRLRDLQAFRGYAHSYNEKTIAVGTVAVNVSRVFWSPTRSADDITEHANIDTLGKSTVELFRGLPLRHTPAEGPGIEAVSLLVVDFDNLRKTPALPYGAPRPQAPKLVTGTPAPQTGDPMHYATMVHRICAAYEARWQRRTR